MHIFVFDGYDFNWKYIPILFQISLNNYSINEIKINNNNTYIVCINKLSNIHRLDIIKKLYNLENLIVCLLNNKEKNYNKIVNLCNEYKIISKDLDDIIINNEKTKNIIAIDLHKDAITLNNSMNIDNSTLIFGYEIGGIPKQLLEKCTMYLQIESRKSINVIGALSIIVSIIN